MKEKTSTTCVSCKKQYRWTKGDLEPRKVDWPLMHTFPNDLTPVETFLSILDDDIFYLLVNHTNRYAARKNHLRDISET